MMNRLLGQRRTSSLPRLGRVGRFLWEALWLPYWLGSTMPPPALPARRVSPATSERTPRLLQELDALRTIIWRQRTSILALRSLWLALAVLDAWLLLRVVAQRQPGFGPFLLLALVLLAFGAFLVATTQPSRGQLARTLDRSFGLRERVATAYEIAERESRIGGVRALQVLEATRVTRKVGGTSVFQRRLPVREIVPLVLLAILGVVLLIALIVQRGGGLAGPGNRAGQANGPSSSAGNTQQNAQGTQPGSAPGNQSGQGPQPGNQPGGQPSAQGRQDLAALAGALQQNGATQAAGNQIANGDYPGAAQSLRDVGQQASQMPAQQRSDLASDLRETAGKVGDPQLAQDLIAAANALEQPNAAGAQRALDQVANDVDRLGQGDGPSGQGNQGNQTGPGTTPGGQSSGGGGGNGGGAAPQLPSGQRTQPSTGAPTEPLGANGQAVQLPKGSPSGQTINTQNQNSRGTGAGDPGAAAAGGGQLRQGAVGEAGVDTNQVPFEQRGTVQQYFTPPPKSGSER